MHDIASVQLTTKYGQQMDFTMPKRNNYQKRNYFEKLEFLKPQY